MNLNEIAGCLFRHELINLSCCAGSNPFISHVCHLTQNGISEDKHHFQSEIVPVNGAKGTKLVWLSLGQMGPISMERRSSTLFANWV